MRQKIKYKIVFSETSEKYFVLSIVIFLQRNIENRYIARPPGSSLV